MDRLLHLPVDPGQLPIRYADDQEHHDEAKQGDKDVLSVFPGKCDHVPNLRSWEGDIQILGLTKS
jgi:hypothetical protein